jgi:hypothetical protein
MNPIGDLDPELMLTGSSDQLPALPSSLGVNRTPPIKPVSKGVTRGISPLTQTVPPATA